MPDGTRVLIAPLTGVGRDYPLSIEKLAPDPLLVRRQGLAGGLRALHPDPALRRHGAHHVDPLEERGRHPAVRPEEAGVPHLRQHADDARLDRPDDRPRPGDDARLRRLGRQHHVRQHLAAAPAEHQAAGVRGPAGRDRPAGRGPAEASATSETGAGRRPKRPAALPKAPGAPGRRAASRPRRWPPGSTSSWRRGATSASPESAAPAPGSLRAATPAARSVRRPCRFRLRGRRPGGDEGGAEAAGRREDDRHPLGARPRARPRRSSCRPAGRADSGSGIGR